MCSYDQITLFILILFRVRLYKHICTIQIDRQEESRQKIPTLTCLQISFLQIVVFRYLQVTVQQSLSFYCIYTLLQLRRAVENSQVRMDYQEKFLPQIHCCIFFTSFLFYHYIGKITSKHIKKCFVFFIKIIQYFGKFETFILYSFIIFLFHMFPSVKGKDQPTKEKVKQREWDDRITKSQIPAYSSLRDKHTKSYRKILMSNAMKGEGPSDDQSRQRKIKRKTYFEKKLDLFNVLKENHLHEYQEIRKYDEGMNKLGAPNFYSYYCLLPLINCTDVKGYLLPHIKRVRDKSTAFNRISAAIQAREECLDKIRITVLNINQSQILEIKNQLKQQVAHYRTLTINAIDEIKRWRIELGNLNQKPIYYSEEQENYLIKILNDNNFIFTSRLSHFINFGEKNDPFLLVPIRKSQGKQKSPFLEIVQSEENEIFYSKYIDYLAAEKAYELSEAMNQNIESSKKKVKSKNPYQTKRNKSKDLIKSLSEEEIQDEDFEKIERQKVREDRLKKNQERINSIKSIYQSYSTRKRGLMSERKIPETDVDEKKNTLRVKSKQKKRKDDQFNDIVTRKLNLQRERSYRKTQKSKIANKSLHKTMKADKSEDKMIENLRGIQQNLKSKLQVIQKEDKAEESFSNTNTFYSKKNQEEVIKQLKLEIIQKIEKQGQEKQRARKKKRQEEEKVLEEIKIKMKKQMEEKLQQRKKQKLLEREQLQKKLKQEEERLNNQRQMQLQLQMKLAKEKEMRELEKVRRQALEKQRKYKEQLEQQKKVRKEKEEVIQKQRRQKENLMNQLRKKQMKEQIEEDLRKQLMEKKQNQQKNDFQEQIFTIKKQKQEELAKEIQILKTKEQSQMNQLKKQNELRERMLTLKQQEEELKRKEVQYLMKNVIRNEKQQIDREALQKRIELEESMRYNLKQKMLEEYKTQKESIIETNRMKREKEMQEEIYRDKIKQKIQKQMRIEAINQTRKDMEQREDKKYELKTKLENIKMNLEKANTIDKEKIQEDVKKQLIQKVIFDKQAERENAKASLRAAFEQELLSSSIPQIYETKDSFSLKHTGHYLEEDHLNKQLQDKPTNQKPQQVTKPQSKFPRDIRTVITTEELDINEKKKIKISELRDNDLLEKKPSKLLDEQQGYQLLNVKQSNEQSGYKVKIVKRNDEQEQRYPKRKKNRKQQSSSSSEDRKKKKKHKKKKRHYSESSSIDSEQQERKQKKKNNKNKKKKKKYDEDEEENIHQDYKSAVKKFGTSDDEKSQQKQRKRKPTISSRKSVQKRKLQDSQKQQSNNIVVHYDIQEKKSKQPNFNKIEPITIKKTGGKLPETGKKFEISLDAIGEKQLDEYLQGHLSRVPKDQLNIMVHQRQELYRLLMGELTFCLLLGHHDKKLGGMAFAYHDRTKSDSRKFVIVHVATYKTVELKQFILSLTNYIFKKDPCDEIEFFYQFDEGNEEQLGFSSDFNKWFDKYGNVFQKKLQEEQQYERKYVLKRQFNQKCDVVLGGVNKNTFRNLFSVYTGVVMSNADLLAQKNQLMDVVTPENQLSYTIMMSELFRSYLTPEQAEGLKVKVKQFVKLKQLLILVVMLQKKKVKMDELKLYEYKSIIELNMKLMSEGKDIIRYVKDSGVEMNRVFFCELNHSFNLPFNFQTTSLPVQVGEEIRQISYFRLSPLPRHKMHTMKSALYNAQLNLLPTQNSKYKVFIMNAQEYTEIKEEGKLDLFMYIRLFLKNVKAHNVSVWKYVWMPEMMDKGAWSVREFKQFLNKDIYAHDSVNISYRQFLPGALIIQPEHRDLVITPPFIVGVMSMTLEQVTEGSPLYARLIDAEALRTLEVQ